MGSSCLTPEALPEPSLLLASFPLCLCACLEAVLPSRTPSPPGRCLGSPPPPALSRPRAERAGHAQADLNSGILWPTNEALSLGCACMRCAHFLCVRQVCVHWLEKRRPGPDTKPGCRSLAPTPKEAWPDPGPPPFRFSSLMIMSCFCMAFLCMG